MDYKELKLAASADSWRVFMLRRADPNFAELQQSIWTRDRHSCQFCGFTAYQCLDVVNYDNDYTNNLRENLITACPLCSQCFFLESVGQGDFGGGTIIYLPEMSQNELNALCHSLFSAMALGLRYDADIKSIYRNLKLRSQIVEKELGEGVSIPSLYGRLLVDARIEDYSRTMSTFGQNLRLLPTPAKFCSQIEAWATAAFSELSHL